ncbi:flagellar biosynthetic protein FliR [bacterium]|nr:flagellar biosynthetic protein FliR [bacterium]
MVSDVFFWVLILSRVSGLILGCPLFSHKNVPSLFKAGLALALTVLLGPMVTVPGNTPETSSAAFLWVARELFFGFGLGWLGSLSLQVAMAAGALIDTQAGLANATLLDPIRGESQPLLANVYHTLAALVFMHSRAPHVMLSLCALSFEQFPLGHGYALGGVGQYGVKLGGWFMLMMVGLTLPMLLALWGVDIILGFLTRLVPQLQLLSAAPPLKLLLVWWLTLLYFNQILSQLGNLPERLWGAIGV